MQIKFEGTEFGMRTAFEGMGIIICMWGEVGWDGDKLSSPCRSLVVTFCDLLSRFQQCRALTLFLFAFLSVHPTDNH